MESIEASAEATSDSTTQSSSKNSSTSSTSTSSHSGRVLSEEAAVEEVEVDPFTPTSKLEVVIAQDPLINVTLTDLTTTWQVDFNTGSLAFRNPKDELLIFNVA